MTATTMGRASSRAHRVAAGEWLVWLMVLLMLGAGLFLRDRIEGRTETFKQDGVTLQYPADWTLLADEEDFHVFHVIDPTSSVQFPTSVRVRRIPLGELGRGASSLGDVALSWSTRQGQKIPIYNVLQIQPTTVRITPQARPISSPILISLKKTARTSVSSISPVANPRMIRVEDWRPTFPPMAAMTGMKLTMATTS